MHNKPSVSVSRDRPFRNTAKIGHDRPKQAVTPYRNDRSRLTEMGGHDGPKYAPDNGLNLWCSFNHRMVSISTSTIVTGTSRSLMS